MLHVPTTTTATPLRTSGRGLRKLLHGKSAQLRKVVAAKLTTGEWQVNRLLPAQAARLCRVSPAGVNEILGRPPRRRSDREIDRLVARIGAERIWSALDRCTSPRIAAE